MAVTRHGELVDTGAGAAVLGKPVRCVAWLANKLASFGASLRAGDIEAAYAAQWAFVQSKLDVGDKLIGAKLGLTSRAEQEAMGVTEPLYGWITSGMIAGAGQPVDRHSLIQPRGAGDRLPVGPRRHRACDRHQRAGRHQRPSSPRWISSTPGYRDYRSPCRMSSPTTPARDGSCSAPRPADLVDLRLVGCALRAGGPWRPRRRGRSWGHPAAALAWLANCLGPRGERQRAGGLVLSGGLTAPVPLEPGQAVTAELDGLGSVEVYSR